MRKQRFSRTAAFVALLHGLGDRGLTSAEGFRDPTARLLLPPRWAGMLAWLARKLPMLPRARDRVIARVDLLVLRTLAIDAEVTTALAAGLEQVVILGAGFDGRAHRMTALGAAHVFEVDHPATQAPKQQLAAGLARTCRELSYVACDFERDQLGERLQASGHRADQPTLWIWEGVTLYLADQAIRATLASIAARSGAGSKVIVEYHDSQAPIFDPYYSLARSLLLALWSEPQIGVRSQAVMRADLEQAGLRVEQDFGVCEWGARFAGATPRPRQRRARLAVASLAT